MNNIITLPKLTEMLSKNTSTASTTVQRFMLDFTSLVTEAIATDGFVKIKGIGMFRRQIVAGKVKIEYTPEKEISDYINKPFAYFEPVQLADGVSADMLEGAVNDQNSVQDTAQPQVQESLKAPVPEITEQVTAPEKTPEPEIVNEVDITEDDTTQDVMPSNAAPQQTECLPPAYTTPVIKEETIVDTVMPTVDSTLDDSADINPTDNNNVPTEDLEPTVPIDTAVDNTESAAIEYSDEEMESAEYPESGNRQFPWFWVAMFFVLGLLIGFAVGYFCHDQISARIYNHVGLPSTPLLNDPDASPIELDLESPEEGLMQDDGLDIDVPTEESEAEAPASVAQNETTKSAAQSAPVYDTVTSKRYLTTMAREHYGDKVYWVYIYLENRDKISNPNNVRAGTRVVIPPKKKYDVSDNESENLRAAQRKQSEIFSKYGIH